jgi:hypothetical protein
MKDAQTDYQKFKLLTKYELCEALGLRSTRIIDAWVKKRMIPVKDLGHRTKLFELDRVRAALDRFEVKEMGRK